jgi:hypothetical protein
MCSIQTALLLQGVLFDAYEPGGVYLQTVQLQNTGTVMRQLRLLPPTSRYFQVSFPRQVHARGALLPTGVAVGFYRVHLSLDCHVLLYAVHAMQCRGTALLITTVLGTMHEGAWGSCWLLLH